MGGSHTLEKFINEVGKDIPDPQVNKSRLGTCIETKQIVNASRPPA